MNKNYRRNAYKQEEALMKAEESLAYSEKPAKKDYNNNTGFKKKNRYKTDIKSVRFEWKSKNRAEFDYAAAMELLVRASFDILSIPVMMNASLLGKTFDKPIIIGYINSCVSTLDGEYFNITVNEDYIDSVKALEEAGDLEMCIKTLVDKDCVPTKLINFEVKPINNK